MKKFSLIALLMLVFTSQAEAAFQVKVTIGATTKTVNDNDVPLGNVSDGNSTANEIFAIFDFNGYRLQVTATTDSPGAGGVGTVTNATVSVRRTTGTDTFVTVEVISDGFLIAGVGNSVTLLNELAPTLLRSNQTGPGASIDGTSTADGTSTPTATATNTTAVTTSTTVLIGNSPFQISSTMVLRNLSNSNSNNQQDANVTLTTTATLLAVPVPPAIALLASALPFGLAFLRRRKAKPTA
ncbi:MAG: hypothetical protein K2W96_00085 [Gemmataceae bacterium]|nr:hypothetical protein [Gemmataceae bacterium]